MDRRFPRSLIRKIETTELPVLALGAIKDMRDYLDEIERECVVKARRLGASSADIAEALGITRQAVHNKLKAYTNTPDDPTATFDEGADPPERGA